MSSTETETNNIDKDFDEFRKALVENRERRMSISNFRIPVTPEI
jgi:hypothetical protein